jgi:chitinase
VISFDTLQVVSQKVEYIKVRHLGGAMWWETSGDQPSFSNNSLMNSAAESLGKHRNNEMEKSENCLGYPQRK